MLLIILLCSARCMLARWRRPKRCLSECPKGISSRSVFIFPGSSREVDMGLNRFGERGNAGLSAGH